MFQQLGAPILGIVENMSYLPLPDGTKHDLFGRGGAEQVAHQLNLPFLGELPMFTELRVNSDAGNPHANYEKNPELRDALNHIVSTLAGEVSKRNVEGAAPELTIS
jgi:ATP-binding protein involved in chromosome partitioning